jgi:hypothetical protein
MYALPCSPELLRKLPFDAFVVGYPGFLPEKKFVEDYGKNVKDSQKLYEAVRNLTGGFQRKVLSTGVCGPNRPCNLLEHRCPTLRGNSGGIFGSLNAAKGNSLRFAGVHIGGVYDMHFNYAIPIDLPAFVYAYVTAVVDEEFAKKHAEELEPILALYNAIA